MSAAAAQKFGELAEAFDEVRSQLKDLADHPDVLQGDRIVKALYQIDSSIKDVVKVVSDSDSKASTRHRELLNHQLAMDYNRIARKYNSNVTSRSCLAVLRDVYKDKPIPNFPLSESDLDYLEDEDVAAILECLGHKDTGSEGKDRLTLSLAVRNGD